MLALGKNQFKTKTRIKKLLLLLRRMIRKMIKPPPILTLSIWCLVQVHPMMIWHTKMLKPHPSSPIAAAASASVQTQ
jgi:hypothetical protein